MDKEAPEIKPTTLDGQNENAVKTVDSVAVQAAAVAAREEKEEYYIDPLEQDALMKKKQEELEARKSALGISNDTPISETIPDVGPEIRPDMNVTGFFSAGETAKKGSILKQPASGGTMKIFYLISLVSVIISTIYAIALIATLYSAGWILGWLYGISFFASVVGAFFAIRSLNITNEQIKKHAILELVFTGISLIPLLMILANMIFKLA